MQHAFIHNIYPERNIPEVRDYCWRVARTQTTRSERREAGRDAKTDGRVYTHTPRPTHTPPHTHTHTHTRNQVDEVTADFVYLRLHGKKAVHAWDYTDEELAPYADKVRCR